MIGAISELYWNYKKKESDEMNKFLIGFCVLAAVYFNWGKLTADATSPANFSANQTQDVVLYATSWCGYCAKARKYFKDNDIAFVEYDVEQSSEGKAQYDQMNGKGVPLIVVKGEIIRGYNIAAIRSALEKPSIE